MKIGVDVRVLLDQNYSGVANFTFYLLREILRLDKSNSYQFFYNSFSRNLENSFLPADKIVRRRYPNKIFNYCQQKIFHRPQFDKVLGGTDLFYSPHLNFSSFSQKTKTVITVHDLSFLRYPEFFSRRKNFWHRALDLKKNLKKFDKIVAVSQNTKNDLLELLKLREDQVTVIYSGLNDFNLDESFYTLNYHDYLKDKYQINGDYILYLGTIEPRKNIARLISAYNLLREQGREELLVLVGSWGWRTKEIYSAWQNSKYKQDIRFINYVDNFSKAVFYQGARVFVYPSLYEGFGFPPLEASYFKVPVLASNVSSLPEVLAEGALLVNPHNAWEISFGLQKILEDESLRNSLLEKSSKRLENFQWSKTAQSYLDLFNSL